MLATRSPTPVSDSTRQPSVDKRLHELALGRAGTGIRAAPRRAPSETGRPRADAGAGHRPNGTSRTAARADPSARSRHAARSPARSRAPRAVRAAAPGRRCSPTSRLPPGNSHCPPWPASGGRWLISRRPPRSINAATTTWTSSCASAVTDAPEAGAPPRPPRASPSATSVAAASGSRCDRTVPAGRELAQQNPPALAHRPGEPRLATARRRPSPAPRRRRRPGTRHASGHPDVTTRRPRGAPLATEIHERLPHRPARAIRGSGPAVRKPPGQHPGDIGVLGQDRLHRRRSSGSPRRCTGRPPGSSVSRSSAGHPDAQIWRAARCRFRARRGYPSPCQAAEHLARATPRRGRMPWASGPSTPRSTARPERPGSTAAAPRRPAPHSDRACAATGSRHRGTANHSISVATAGIACRCRFRHRSRSLARPGPAETRRDGRAQASSSVSSGPLPPRRAAASQARSIRRRRADAAHGRCRSPDRARACRPGRGRASARR